jgi:hypothetical protein
MSQDSVQGISSDLSLQLTDLSPAEVAFHHHLLSLHSHSLPNFKHKLAELDRKSEQIQQIQQEMKQAAKSDARKGLAGPDTKTAWSEKQIEAIKPIIANQYDTRRAQHTSQHANTYPYVCHVHTVLMFICSCISSCVCIRSSAINSLVQQLADLHKTMTTLRSHAAWQRRKGPNTPTQGQQGKAQLMLQASNDHDQPL